VLMQLEKLPCWGWPVPSGHVFLLFFLFYFTATSPDSRQHSVAKTDQTTRRGGKKGHRSEKGNRKRFTSCCFLKQGATAERSNKGLQQHFLHQGDQSFYEHETQRRLVSSLLRWSARRGRRRQGFMTELEGPATAGIKKKAMGQLLNKDLANSQS